MGPSACRRAFEAIGAPAARDDCSGNGQVRGQIETTAATLAIPSGYVKPRRNAARGIAMRTAHTAATGVHVLSYEDLGKAIGTKDATYIAAALHGQHRLNTEEAKRLAAAVGIDIETAMVTTAMPLRTDFPLQRALRRRDPLGDRLRREAREEGRARCPDHRREVPALQGVLRRTCPAREQTAVSAYSTSTGCGACTAKLASTLDPLGGTRLAPARDARQRSRRDG